MFHFFKNTFIILKVSRIIFIADAHLKNVEDKEYVDLLVFLDRIYEKKDEIKALYILGDLFDFFIAFPQVVFYQHMLLLSYLQKLTEAGIKVFYFEGNHDFFLKKLNVLGYQVEIIESHLSLHMDGKYYISHGDLLDPSDYQHKALSSIVRNPITYVLAYVLPPYLVYHFAHWFSNFSRKNISGKKEFSEKIFNMIVPSLVNKGYKGAILGHFHENCKLDIKCNGKNFQTYLVGSWKKDRSYLTYDYEKKIFETKNFNKSLKHL